MENYFFGVPSNEPDFDPADGTTVNPDSVVSKNRSDQLEETYKDDNAYTSLQANDLKTLPQLSKEGNVPEIEEMDLPDTEMGISNGLETANGKISAEKTPEDVENRELSVREEPVAETWNMEEEKDFGTEYSVDEKDAKNQELTGGQLEEPLSDLNSIGSKEKKSLNKKMNTPKQSSNLDAKSQLIKAQKAHTKGKFSQKSNLDNLRQIEENPIKKQTKKQLKNKHLELVNTLQMMSTFNWLENYGVNQKNHPMKSFNPISFWFLTCTNYFPRNAFTHKNNKEFIHQRMNKLKNMLPDIPQRITKADITSEMIERRPVGEFESLLLNSLSKATKYSLDSYKSNSYVQKIMSYRTVNPLYQPEYTAADDEWIMEARRCIYDNYMHLIDQNFLKSGDYDFFENPSLLSKVDLQDLITFYEKDLYEVLTDNEKKMNELEKNTLECINREDIIHKVSPDDYDSLVDLKIRFPEEDAFINLLEKKQNEEKESVTKNLDAVPTGGLGMKNNGKSSASYISIKTKPRINLEESICHICNDEDYSEDDLIVFCSKCNISVHQKCYGLPTLPNGDWICDVCMTFEENGKYLRCPFCDKRGGAMKPTCTKADTKIFESSNPNYHKFIQSYAYPDVLKTLPKAKTYAMLPQKHKNEDDSEGEEKPEDLFYDFQLIDDNYTEEELENEPRFPQIWVHISCALFVPELYFADDVTMSGVLGLENVSKERFKHDCSVCEKKKGGAIVNCEKANCKKAFHPECARRAKQFLDIRENDSNQFVYHIYCEKHTPLKLKRTIESIESKMREDLNRFFKTIERQHAAYLTEMKVQGIERPQTQAILKDQEIKSLQLKKKKALSIKEEGNYFLKLIEKYVDLYKNMPFTMTLEKILTEDYADQYKLIDTTFPRNIAKNDKKLTPEDEIWTVMPYKNLTPEQKYLKYKKLFTQTKKKIAIKGTKSKAGLLKFDALKTTKKGAKAQKANTKVVLTNEEIEEESSGEIVCICQKPYHGELMIQCEKCEIWYHPGCIGLNKAEKKLKKMKWICHDCQGIDNKYAEEERLLKKRTASLVQTTKDKKSNPKKKTKL